MARGLDFNSAHLFSVVVLPPSLSESSNLLDEDRHFILLNCAGTVLVEFFETRLEILLREFATISAFHVAKSLLDKGFGFILVESPRIILVVLGPDVVDALLDNSIDVLVRHLICL